MGHRFRLKKHKLAEAWGREGVRIANWIFLGFQRTWVTRVTVSGITHGYKMTMSELQSALAEATQTDKKTAGVFLDTLGALAYKEIKKTGEFVLPGFGKLVKQKRKARTGFNPKTQQKIKIPAKTVVKFRVAKAAKDGVFGVKK
jgi:DNA-binding protein HU-beta